jgi:hypothetical protein
MALSHDRRAGAADVTRWRRLYPALFAIVPILGLATRNPGRLLLRDALVLCALALLATALVYLLVYALVWMLRRGARDPFTGDVAALVTFGVVALFYLYPLFAPAAACASAPVRCAYVFLVENQAIHLPLQAVKHWMLRHPIAGAGGALALAAGGVFVMVMLARTARRAASGSGTRRFSALERLGSVLTLAGALVIVMSLAQAAIESVASARAIARSTLVRDLARPVPLRASAPPAAPKRDVYVLVLDAYPSATVLREQYGYDNSPFEDSLRTLGFRIPAVRSNYAVTLLSLGSFLNFAHVHPLVDVVSPSSRDYRPATYLLQHNRLARFLEGRGYRFVFFPAKAYAPTQESPLANEVVRPRTGLDLSRALYGSGLAVEVATTTLFAPARGFFRPYPAMLTEFARETFDGLAAMPPSATPTLAVAHVLMPHLPVVADGTCRPLREPSWERAAMSGQMDCVNRMTLRTIHALLARSSIPPIIIIQGDHGSEALHQFETPPEEQSVAQSRERFQPFGAYYLPAGGGSAMPDSLSLVNVLRYVLDFYFGTDLQPLADTMYFASWKLPYHMVEVGEDFRVRLAPGTPRRD